MAKKPHNSRFSSAFYRALEAAQAFLARGESNAQLAEIAKAKLREGTTLAGLVEATGWPAARVRSFLRTVLQAQPDAMSVRQDGAETFYKLIDRH